MEIQAVLTPLLLSEASAHAAHAVTAAEATVTTVATTTAAIATAATIEMLANVLLESAIQQEPETYPPP